MSLVGRSIRPTRISHSAIVGRADGREPDRRSPPRWRPGGSNAQPDIVMQLLIAGATWSIR
jgi:hypothetical protein